MRSGEVDAWMRQETRVRLALASDETMGGPTQLVRANEVVGEEIATGRRYGLLVVSCLSSFHLDICLGITQSSSTACSTALN